ncbi:MAG: DUF3524 domain-containing protein [Bacteroidia bacterium]|nr:DUF3524 domain-containing protein [Bacteroidia bacterium]
MKIQIIEPFFTGSHAAWAEGYARHSRHRIQILSLQGRYWKWRMHGGAVSLAREFMAGDFQPDLLLVSDMLDLTTFLALTRQKSHGIPNALYFHENQLTYPWSPDDLDPGLERDNHYSFLNFTSALAADRVFFNSAYHQQSFLDELPRFLSQFPDYNELSAVDQIRSKSAVLPLGLDLGRFDQVKGFENPGKKPLILWNHRWEYDKNPGDFFAAMYALDAEGYDFELALLGERFRKEPRDFIMANELLGSRIVQYGYADSFTEYAQWLQRADLLPVTSNQDFFGGSVVEAMYCGCFPLLPNRLAYPEHIPTAFQEKCIYQNQNDLLTKLRAWFDGPSEALPVREWVKGYDWSQLAARYDDVLEQML